MGAALSFNSCGPWKGIILDKIGQAVVIALKAVKGQSPEAFNQAIQNVMDKFCKSRGLIEPPFLVEIKEKIKDVIMENFAEDMERFAAEAARAIEAKALKHARDKKVDAMLEAYAANGNAIPSGAADLSIMVHGKAGKKTGGPTKDTDCPVFISFKYSEGYDEAKILETRLKEKGVKSYMCDAASKDGEEVSEALSHAQVIVLLATRTYGKNEAGNSVDTSEEMMYATQSKKAFPVKLGQRVKPNDQIEGWQVPMTFIKLSHLLYESWEKKTVIPVEIVDKVYAALEEKKKGDK